MPTMRPGFSPIARASAATETFSKRIPPESATIRLRNLVLAAPYFPVIIREAGGEDGSDVGLHDEQRREGVLPFLPEMDVLSQVLLDLPEEVLAHCVRLCQPSPPVRSRSSSASISSGGMEPRGVIPPGVREDSRVRVEMMICPASVAMLS